MKLPLLVIGRIELAFGSPNKEPNYVSQVDLTLRGDIKEGGGARVELHDRDRIAVSAA